MATTVTEDVTSQVDGVAVVFTTSPYNVGTLEVHLNGVRLLRGVGEDFVEIAVPEGFQIVNAPRVGDTLQVQFETDAASGAIDAVVVSGRDDC